MQKYFSEVIILKTPRSITFTGTRSHASAIVYALMDQAIESDNSRKAKLIDLGTQALQSNQIKVSQIKSQCGMVRADISFIQVARLDRRHVYDNQHICARVHTLHDVFRLPLSWNIAVKEVAYLNSAANVCLC